MARRKRSPTTSSQPMTSTERLASVIKSCRQIMRKDKGLSGDLDRLPLLTWVMFLKFLDDMERIEESRSRMRGENYQSTIAAPYRWRDWAANESGITGSELNAFINQEKAILPGGSEGQGLFAYLSSLHASPTSRKRIIASVFSRLSNRMQSGYLLRDVINHVNQIHFESQDELFTLGHLYESMLREMRDSAGDSGEFYTPRPVVRFMVSVTNPRLGEVILDPACGTGGFLVEAFQYMSEQVQTVEDRRTLQNNSIFGGEAKPLPFLLCQMNLLLHGLEAPQIDPGNSLRFPLNEIGNMDRVDVIITNPPFGGEEERGILNNFPENKRTTETALLFIQLIMRKLKRGKKPGRAAVVVPNGTLSNPGVCDRLREELLREFNLHTIVRLPNGVFAPYTPIPTNILFFDCKKRTEEVWYYQLPLPEGRKNYTKTKPLQFSEFENCLKWWNEREESEHSWLVSLDEIIQYNDSGDRVSTNLDIGNPNSSPALKHLAPDELVSSIISKEQKIIEEVSKIQAVLSDVFK